MVTKLLLTISLLISSAGFSLAQSDTLNQLDTLGRRQGLWIVYENYVAANGFPTDSKVEEGRYIDNSKEGVWTTYYKDGETPKVIGEYKYNCPDGKYKKFYKSGILKEEGTYTSHHYIGELKKYFPTGELEYLGNYNDNGQEVDTTIYYYKNGCKELMLTFNSDGSDQNLYSYHSDKCNVLKDSTIGRHDIICTAGIDRKDSLFINMLHPKVSRRYSSEKNRQLYSDKALCSPNQKDRTKKYSTGKEVLFDGICKEEKVWEGKMYFYDEDGILLFVEIWKDGAYHSDGQL